MIGGDIIQTFLPYPNLVGSARVLDSRRLGKQRVENMQIMQRLLGYRVSNTAHIEQTGEYRTVFLNDAGEELAFDEDFDPLAFRYRTEVPITRVVPNPESEWQLEPITNRAWINHPVVLMWVGYEHLLMRYQQAICEEWNARGYKTDTCFAKTKFLFRTINPPMAPDFPPWFGDDRLHLSHQSILLQKHPIYYRQFFHDVPENLPCFYPVTKESRKKQAL